MLLAIGFASRPCQDARCCFGLNHLLFTMLMTSRLSAHVGWDRIIDQLYALQLVHRTNGTSGYNIGIPVGFERDGRIFVYNHYRIIIHYHGNSEGEKSASVGAPDCCRVIKNASNAAVAIQATCLVPIRQARWEA